MYNQDFSKKSALLIEDMAEARIMQKKMLNDFGFGSIEIAMKAETAIELLQEKSYDVILSDYNLGRGKDGQELLEEIRLANLIPHTTSYLMVTAETSIEMVMGAIEYQPDGYITKPFSQAVLQRRLGKLLNTKEKLEKVNIALDKQDYVEAIELAYQVQKEHPQLEGRCQRIIGESLLKLKEYKVAITLFNKNLKARKMPWALFGKAQAFYHLGKLDKAEKMFSQLMMDNRFFVSAYDWLAKIKIAQKLTPEAQSILMEAAEKSPKNLPRQIELGRICMQVKDYENAEAAYRRAVFLAKNSCNNKAEIYLNHLHSIVKLAENQMLLKRHENNFESTQKKIHNLFFESPTVRAFSYQYQIDLLLAKDDAYLAKPIYLNWLKEIKNKICAQIPNEKQALYQSSFGE
ncbi:response regulator [Marinomonas epiphytica]